MTHAQPDHGADGALSSALCPCGSGATFDACCGPFLDGSAVAPTAERLMRSRYSAFAVGNAAYLLSTWHPSTRPEELRLHAEVEWRRLEILDAVAGGPDDGRGEVEFRAFGRILPAPGRARDGGVLHERSRFVRESGRWLYLDGDVSA
ncbi:YchJ family protein [Humibacter sp.]|uniref:YchJ family protein n=1 Tax=Humibacter sp. TaxID=1940291 RepID=UPI002C64F577|nr:YchJ family protein [Humibacter sp.]HVX08383.1 YchJ family protein [Humibacter sp.]